MTLSHSIRCSIASHLVPGAVLALATIALSGPLDYARADTGHWTPPSNWSELDQERYAVHMLLLRGDNNPFHSRIL